MNPHHGKTNSKMKYHNLALNHNIHTFVDATKITIVVESQLVWRKIFFTFEIDDDILWQLKPFKNSKE